jgi:DnaJ-domain-containing protein 1
VLVLLPKRRSRLQGEPPLDNLDEVRLGLGPKYDPFHADNTFASRMRTIRQQAQESRQRNDYYSLLGVDPGASDTEIERAFRSRVITIHPDRFVGDPEAQERAAASLRQLNQAVAVLRDPLARARYDAGRMPQK